MPVRRHQRDTTPRAADSTQEQAAPVLPEQQTFQHHLREPARAAIRVVLEGVMREELDALYLGCKCENSTAHVGDTNLPGINAQFHGETLPQKG